MRVYIPDKRDSVINEALKDLYLLRQSVDFQAGTVGSRLKMIDCVREKLRDLLDREYTEE